MDCRGFQRIPKYALSSRSASTKEGLESIVVTFRYDWFLIGSILMMLDGLKNISRPLIPLSRIGFTELHMMLPPLLRNEVCP